MSEIYDTIGQSYAKRRRADPRIADQIDAALGDAHRVLNVGAGAGSYEPAGRDVVALEPSRAMIAQRPEGAAPVVQGRAEALPFADASFDAAMAVLTVHHWSDPRKGLSELRRVAKGPVVVLTFDVGASDFWLFDYFPALRTLDQDQMPSMSLYRAALGKVEIAPVLIPHDCQDGFLSAYWRRPEAYLDQKVRAGMSSFWKIGDITPGLDRLRADLDSGRWAKTHAALLNAGALDCGYRLVRTL